MKIELEIAPTSGDRFLMVNGECFAQFVVPVDAAQAFCDTMQSANLVADMVGADERMEQWRADKAARRSAEERALAENLRAVVAADDKP